MTKPQIKWPVLFIHEETLSVVKAGEFNLCSMAAFNSKFYRNLKFVDTAGNSFIVLNAKLNPPVKGLKQLLYTIMNKHVTVDLDYELTSQIHLEHFKNIVCLYIDAQEIDCNMWSGRGDVDELKSEIRGSHNFKSIMTLIG